MLIHHEMFDNRYSRGHSLGCRLGEEHQGPSGGDSGEQNSLFQGPTSRTYSGSSLHVSGPQSHICDLRTVTQAPVSSPAVGGSGKLMWKKVFYKVQRTDRAGFPSDVFIVRIFAAKAFHLHFIFGGANKLCKYLQEHKINLFNI